MSAPGPLVWIDCEMTGLNPRTDQILEICCVVTDGDLEVIENNGYERVIHANASTLEAMDDWCRTTHKKTGLWDKSLASQLHKEEADEELLAYLKRLMPKGKGVLAGNTVHMDRLFMFNEFPKSLDWLHYRIVDVSSVKEIGYRQNPSLMRRVPKKKLDHSARSDILESISELRWYYDNYFRPASEGPGETTATAKREPAPTSPKPAAKSNN